jgi:branched-chain amino acid transport system substrate-binding protein
MAKRKPLFLSVSLGVLVILSIVLSSCGGTAPTTAAPSGSGQGTSGEPIIIGGALSLTGIQAPLDEPGLRGAQVAEKYLNDHGGILGRPVKFINLDGKSDPVTVGNVTVQLIQQGAAAIVAPCDFDFGGPASREAQKAGLVGISTCASSPRYGSKALGDKQFTLSMWNTTMGAAAAQYAFNEKKWKSAYVVTDTFIDYTTSLSQYFIEDFKSLGGQVVFEDTYTQGDQDFSAQLARIKALPQLPDFIYISSYNPDLTTIIRTIREAGIKTPIMGGDSYDDPALWEGVGPDYGNDIYFVTHSWMGPEAGQKIVDFLKLYQAMFNKAPDTSFVATGYDTLMVLAQAMDAAKSTDGAAVAKVMESTQFDLLTGKLTWSSAADGHEPNIETVIVQVQGGKPEFVEWLAPTNVPKP